VTRTRNRLRMTNREDRTMTTTTTTETPAAPRLSRYGYPIPADLAPYWDPAADLIGDKREVGDDRGHPVTIATLSDDPAMEALAWRRRCQPAWAEDRYPASAGFKHTKVKPSAPGMKPSGAVDVTVDDPARVFNYFAHAQHAGVASQLRDTAAAAPTTGLCPCCGVSATLTASDGLCPPCAYQVGRARDTNRVTSDGRDRADLAAAWLSRQTGEAR
jgi:hypothetical protein